MGTKNSGGGGEGDTWPGWEPADSSSPPETASPRRRAQHPWATHSFHIKGGFPFEVASENTLAA